LGLHSAAHTTFHLLPWWQNGRGVRPTTERSGFHSLAFYFHATMLKRPFSVLTLLIGFSSWFLVW